MASVREWLVGTLLWDAANAHSLDGWITFIDEDGAICLLPDDERPPLAIVLDSMTYHVLVCSPDNPREIGPFQTLADAMRGLVQWVNSAKR